MRDQSEWLLNRLHGWQWKPFKPDDIRDNSNQSKVQWDSRQHGATNKSLAITQLPDKQMNTHAAAPTDNREKDREREREREGVEVCSSLQLVQCVRSPGHTCLFKRLAAGKQTSGRHRHQLKDDNGRCCHCNKHANNRQNYSIQLLDLQMPCSNTGAVDIHTYQ